MEYYIGLYPGETWLPAAQDVPGSWDQWLVNGF